MLFNIKGEGRSIFLFYFLKCSGLNITKIPSKSENKAENFSAFRRWTFPKSQELKGKL